MSILTGPERTGKQARHLAAVATALLALSPLLASCGSSHATAGHAASVSAARSAASGQRTTSSSASAGQGSAGAPSGASFTASRLASLSNYTFTLTTSETVNGAHELYSNKAQVHSPNDWQFSQTINGHATGEFFDVGGRGYDLLVLPGIHSVKPVSLKTPDGLDTLQGEPYWARDFVNMAHDPAFTIAAAGSCSVAGVAGTQYSITAMKAGDQLVGAQKGKACIANASGALLSLSFGATGGSVEAGVGVGTLNQSFTVTSIGGVAPIGAPTG